MRQILAAFALLALTVRALIPAGYMLGGQDSSGQQAFVTLCSASGTIEIAVDLKTGVIQETRGKHSSDGKAHPPCVFAGAALFDAPILSALPGEGAPRIAPLPWSPAAPRPGLGLAAPPPPALGPPTLI